MTKYLVDEIVTPGYIIDRGIYDNPKDAQYRAMEIFVEGIIEENQWSASKISLMLKQLLKSMSSIVRNYIGGIYKCPL